MTTIRTIAICASQVPFRSGGAEVLAGSLHQELNRRGYVVEIVQVPFKWYPRVEVLKSCLAWRLLDLTESDGDRIDLVIATKFPSYVVKHPNKVTWLVHQYRQAYDLAGTPLSDFTGKPEDIAYQEAIAAIDRRTLSESKRLFAIAKNVSRRLERFNQLQADTLYPPPKLTGQYRNDEYGEYLFSVSRLDQSKRVDLLIHAMKYVSRSVRLVIAGTGPERDALARLIEELDLGDRVVLAGYVSDEELLSLYAKCFAVAYVPVDEDYGYVTPEAFASEKPVITAADCGGVLEFVNDGVTGFVTDGRPESIAARIDCLWLHREQAAAMGHAGRELIKDITWDHVVDRLLDR